MGKFKIIFIFSLFVSAVFGELERNDSNATYRAVVVEFNIRADMTGQQRLDENPIKVLEIIESLKNQSIDIIVFPESILNDIVAPVPLANSVQGQSPCNLTNVHQLIRNISCAAAKVKSYVVIDLVIKDDAGDLYNTAIVFDRNGAIIAKYRKTNLFGEPGIKTPSPPDVVAFKTDFNVTFGIFICFDMFFEQPAMTLVNQGIKHFIFPTMWYSELPYLTALQIQHGWAYSNNLVLLAANANNPSAGSSGSGIFAGRFGALEMFVDDKPNTRTLVATVPVSLRTPNFTVNSDWEHDMMKRSVKPNESESESESELNVWKEDLSGYKIHFVDVSRNGTKVKGSICENGFCCHYALLGFDLGNVQNKPTYHYAVSVNNGFRDHAETDMRTSFKVCSLIACTEPDNWKSCGQRHSPSLDVARRFKFDSVNLTAEFPVDNAHTMPNGLLMNLHPLDKNQFNFQKIELKGESRFQITMNLTTPTTELLTFGTYTRDYKRDTHKNAAAINKITLKLLICIVLATFSNKLV